MAQRVQQDDVVLGGPMGNSGMPCKMWEAKFAGEDVAVKIFDNPSSAGEQIDSSYDPQRCDLVHARYPGDGDQGFKPSDMLVQHGCSRNSKKSL